MNGVSRAYSLLKVKSIAAAGDVVVIKGIATTPAPDRAGDIVDPLGASYVTPMPLLWQHDSMQPVGRVMSAKASKAGIEVEVHMPVVTEPGTLKDRIDEAIQSVKLGLVSAFSIGFRVINDAVEYIAETNGLKFLQWEWYELSLVTIPANAQATIDVVKSIDHKQVQPSEGRDALIAIAKSYGSAVSTARADSTLAAKGGVKALSSEGTTMSAIQKQIEQFEATRAAKDAARAKLMEDAAEKGITLDDDQASEYDELTAEVAKIDAHLKRLDTQEKAEVSKAQPVNGQNSQGAQRSRGTEVSVIGLEKKLQPGILAVRIAICKYHALKENVTPDEMAKRLYPEMQMMQKGLEAERAVGGMKNFFAMEKAAVPAATTTGTTWAQPLITVASAFTDFVDYLRPNSIIGQFGLNGVPDLNRQPFNSRQGQETSGGTGYWVGESQAKPVTRFDYAASTLLWTKLAAIVVQSEEFERFAAPGAEDRIRNSLRKAINGTMDLSFIDPTSAAVTGVRPASITNGVTAITPSGTTPAAFRTDLRKLWAAWSNANLEEVTPVYIMDATTALGISSMVTTLESAPLYPDLSYTGGKIGNVPAIVTNYAPHSSSGGFFALVNASDIYLADDGEVTIDASREASIVMDSAPTMASAPTPPGAAMVSMWQTNSIAIRGERYINWAKRRALAVQYINGANYVG